MGNLLGFETVVNKGLLEKAGAYELEKSAVLALNSYEC
jgi:hypothetical protein